MPVRSHWSPWLLLPLVLAAGFVGLGLWQLDRLRERRAERAQAEGALAAPPVTLPDSALPHRQVRASGTWDYAHQLALRAQSRRDVPGVGIVTPLRFPGESLAVLVVRGFVSSADGVGVDWEAVPAEAGGSIGGIALPLRSRADSGRPLERDGHWTWKTLDSAAVASRLPYRILGVFVVQRTGEDSLSPWRIRPPAWDDGPHLSYALQWFAFAAVTLVGAGFWVRRNVEARRHGDTGR